MKFQALISMKMKKTFAEFLIRVKSFLCLSIYRLHRCKGNGREILNF